MGQGQRWCHGHRPDIVQATPIEGAEEGVTEQLVEIWD